MEWREQTPGKAWLSNDYAITCYKDFYTLYIYKMMFAPAGADMRYGIEALYHFKSLDEAKHFAEMHYLTGA